MPVEAASASPVDEREEADLAAAVAYSERFDAAPFGERVDLLRSAVPERWFTEAEAFRSVDLLYDEAAGLGARLAVDDLIATLKSARPDVYNADAPDYLAWRIGNALADGRRDKLPALAAELGPLAPRRPDLFGAVLDEIAYAGELTAAQALTAAALPAIAESGGLPDDTKSGFTDRAFKYLLFNNLEHDPTAVAEDSALRAMLAASGGEPDPAFLVGLVGRLLHRTRTDWKLSLLQPPRADKGRRPLLGQRTVQRTPPIDPLQLYFLGAEFVGYLRYVEGVAYPRGELGGQEIARYLADRQSGKLEGSLAYQREPRPRPPAASLADLVLPDRTTLARYLNESFDRHLAAFHRAAAALVLLPAWLRFLVDRGAVRPERAAALFVELAPLPAELFDQWELGPDEAALRRDVESAWSGTSVGAGA